MPGFVKSIKVLWIVIALVAFSFLGTGVVTQFLVRNEHKYKTREIFSKGNYLASIIALHSIEDFEGKSRENFLRTFRDYLFSERLVYCLIQATDGRTLLALAPQGLMSAIPEDIQKKSLHSLGLTTQSYSLRGLKYPIYEFAKPIFHSGEKTGTVRLGFKAPAISLLSPDRVSLLAMIAFFIFATGTFVYYGMARALRPLKLLSQSFGIKPRNSGSDTAASEKPSGFVEIVQDLEQSYLKISETLKKTESENAKIISKLGVATFEKNQIAKIIDSFNFGIIITDTQDHVNYINTYMLNILKKKRNEAVSRLLKEIIPNKDITSFVANQKSGGTIGRIEIEFPEFAPGEAFQLSLSYIKDGEESVVGKMMSVKNITGDKSAEKTQHEFIANVAHEFLTPLTTINSYTEMLMDEEVSDKEMQKDFYNIINEEIIRLTGFIKNLLSMSKIEIGGLALEKGLVKTDWLVTDSIAGIEKAAIEKEIYLIKHLPDNFPTLVGDKELLKTAVINFLSNAVKYTPKNGQITLSLFEEDSHVIFEISDTGCGIAEEDLPHIFDKFYRSKNPSVAEQTGSGIGLAMASEIVHLHGGNIDVKSELNEGTQFTMRLPKEEYYLGKE